MQLHTRLGLGLCCGLLACGGEPATPVDGSTSDASDTDDSGASLTAATTENQTATAPTTDSDADSSTTAGSDPSDTNASETDPSETNASETGETSETNASETSETSETDPSETDPSDSDTDPSSESSTSRDETETTAGVGVLEVRAFAVPGGLDRIWILAADAVAGTCTGAVLVWPANLGAGPSLPDGWGWQAAWISDELTDCDAPGQGFAAVEATSSSGEIGWAGAPEPYPCAIDIDVQLDFVGAPAWVPASQDLAAAGVAVEGAPGC